MPEFIRPFVASLGDASRIVTSGAAFTLRELDEMPAPTAQLIPLVRGWIREMEADAQKKAYDRERSKHS